MRTLGYRDIRGQHRFRVQGSGFRVKGLGVYEGSSTTLISLVVSICGFGLSYLLGSMQCYILHEIENRSLEPYESPDI